MTTKTSRAYQKQFEVAVPVEAVWRAITEGEELTRWFCQKATCEHGVGGRHDIDWGGGAQATNTITVWEPNVHLRTEANRDDLTHTGRARPTEPYATDWYLEHDSGITRVRMVASGFGEGPEWDHEYDGTFHGWDMFHRTMKHYLEHHLGQPSTNTVIYAMLSVPADEAWARLMSTEGLLQEGRLEDLRAGARFRFTTSQGDLFEGVVHHCTPAKTFSATVESWNKAILNIELASMPGHGQFLYLCLMTWGLPKDVAEGLGSRVRGIVYTLFPQTTDTPKSACAVSENEPMAVESL